MSQVYIIPGVFVGKHNLETSDDANIPSSSHAQDPSTPPTKRSKVTSCRPNKVRHVDCLYIKHDYTDIYIMYMHRVHIQLVKQ